MWVFMFHCMLSLIIQPAVTENSTQMYYAKIKVDRSIMVKISEMLNFIVNSDVSIGGVEMTTVCNKSGTNKMCECQPGYRWSDEACLSVSCCDQKICSLKNDSVLHCVLISTVGVTGSLTLEGDAFKKCLTDKSSQEYQNCSTNLSQQMQAEYSKIKGFDNLNIQQYRTGSVIVDFAMKIVSSAFNTSDLLSRSGVLVNNLNGTLVLETTGIVTLNIARASVLYQTSTEMNCATQEDLGANPQWRLQREDGTFEIVNGRISTVTKQTKKSDVTIRSVDELWQGMYVCLFVQKENKTIINHKANGTLDVCLKPKIDISADPPFPLCNKDTDYFLVKVISVITKSSENYTVNWEDGLIRLPDKTDGDKLIYTAQKLVDCKTSVADVVCNFTNRCNQTQTAKMTIDVIYPNEAYCPADGEWPQTKANFTAKIKCTDQAGSRKRRCNNINPQGRIAKWEAEVSECVQKDLSNVLQKALITDIGLGVLESNVASVLDNFENVTKTEKLPGYANLITSVQVLKTVNEKLSNKTLTNQSAIDDFLHSSSHLLNVSLNDSWIQRPLDYYLVAETFMVSVESLISISDVTRQAVMENLEVSVCQTNNCSLNVLGTNVSLPDGRVVKATGFRNLENYLPHNTTQSVINSMIVSTTANNTNNIKITIDFNITNARPRNVEFYCAFWNITSNNFSTEGCKWEGPSNEARCVCTHLSSFAILMSKKPLEVPGLTYVTYGVLSVSVLSLIITLVIELIVWSDVVKTSTLYLRHTAHVHISLCLLVGNLSFLASSSNPASISDLWCRTSVVLKHFSYLAMFFWMFCLSSTLLHKAVFWYHNVSKKNYLKFSLVVGYFCPLLIVFITFLTNDGGAEGKYYSKDTCWLVYGGLMKGTFFTFIIPVGTIVFINVFSMLVVIMKLISQQSEIQQKTDMSPEKEKAAAKTVVRSVILLTPIFGVTWIFGFAFLALDLTSGTVAYAVNYLFTLLNGLQGFFILLTTSLGDKMTRDALRKYFKKKKLPETSMSTSTTKLESTWKE